MSEYQRPLKRIERPVVKPLARLPHHQKLVALVNLQHARDPAILLYPLLAAWLQILGLL